MEYKTYTYPYKTYTKKINSIRYGPYKFNKSICEIDMELFKEMYNYGTNINSLRTYFSISRTLCVKMISAINDGYM